MLMQCASPSSPYITIAKNQLSSTDKAELTLSLNSDSIKLSLKNTSEKEIVVDKKLEFLLDITMYDRNGEKYIPSIRYDPDIHKTNQQMESKLENEELETKNSFRRRFVVLNPGDSISRVIKENEGIDDYLYAFSFEGKSSIVKYSYRCPRIQDIQQIRIEYGESSWNAPIVHIKSNMYDYEVPNGFLWDDISLHWSKQSQK